MNRKDNITPEVKELLDALSEPVANQRRQEQLIQLIDSLAAQENEHTPSLSLHSSKDEMPAASRIRISRPWWWAGIVATAACLLLFFIQMPSNNVPIVTPYVVATTDVPSPTVPAVKEPTAAPTTTPSRHSLPNKPILLAQTIAVETIEEPHSTEVFEQIDTDATANPQETNIPTTLPSTPPSTKPTRRVVACNKLVCYDCKPKRNIADKQRMSDKTIFGIPAATNMDEGMLMLASL